ncbi:YqeG family HAD IIIA-type phosphatase [Halalkalibacter oceani]|uniref:YqeG family HAD IIIA-type phosphatase n=1 Tax=Halalkalibacter oceani TaxID=1653776 RepID=UPI0032E7FB87
MRLLNKLLPNQYEKSIYNIDLDALRKKGIKGVITDLDNTLVEWDRPDATPEVRAWLKQLREAGMKVTIVSNNTSKRVKAFAEPEGIVFIHAARKPQRRAFRQACQAMELAKDEVVVIGDQIFTDVLGGNRAGLHTILVVPVSSSDGWATRLNRRMERIVLNWMKRRGMIQWEDE